MAVKHLNTSFLELVLENNKLMVLKAGLTSQYLRVGKFQHKEQVQCII